MNDKQILIVSSSVVSAELSRYFKGRDRVVSVYLGKDAMTRRAVEARLGRKFEFMNISKSLDVISEYLREPFVHWMNELNKNNGEELLWWFGAVSSRNTYQSNIFLYLCYREFLNKKHKLNGELPTLIVVDSYGLGKMIEGWAKEHGINAKLCRNGFSHMRIRVIIVASVSWIKFIAETIIGLSVAVITQLIYKKKKIDTLSRPVVIDTFVYKDSISQHGEFKDRLYPQLYEYLSSKNIDIVVHPVLYGFGLNTFSVYARMRKSQTNFIIKEDFLELIDYFRAFAAPWRLLSRKPKTDFFRGVDISEIVEEDNFKQYVSIVMTAVLIYRLFLRLKKYNLNPRYAIDWYENQVIDKAFIAGFRHSFPSAKILGAQIFLHYPNALNLFPCESEVKAGLVPDVILGTSQQQCGITKAFSNNLNCKPAAALRYAHIFKDHSASILPPNDFVLALLPFDISDAADLFLNVREASGLLGKNVKFLIKTHPDYNIRILLKRANNVRLPDNFVIVDEHLSQLFKTCSVVVSTASSSLIEAAARGIPGIYVTSKTTLNQNILKGTDLDMVSECSTPQEIANSILIYLKEHPDKRQLYKKLGMAVREMFFTPVNNDTLHSFIISDLQLN